MNLEDFFQGIAVGRGVPMRSVDGHEFAKFPDFIGGELRACFLPSHWYAAPSKAEGRQMTLTKRGWLFMTTREQLAQDIADTLGQVTSGYGTVTDLRYETLRRLVTGDEWMEAEEVFLAHNPPPMAA